MALMVLAVLPRLGAFSFPLSAALEWPLKDNGCWCRGGAKLVAGLTGLDSTSFSPWAVLPELGHVAVTFTMAVFGLDRHGPPWAASYVEAWVVRLSTGLCVELLHNDHCQAGCNSCCTSLSLLVLYI